MRNNRVFLVMLADLINYPPALSLINILLDLGYTPYFIGHYSDSLQKEYLESKGVIFYETLDYPGKASIIVKFISQIKYKNAVKKALSTCNATKDDFVWFLNADTIYSLNSIIGRYKSILLFYEFVKPHLSWKYWIYNPLFDMEKTMKSAYKVVHCEYNRAHITKGLYRLKELPVILPNKPYVEEQALNDIPSDVKTEIEKIRLKINGKKVILYQGLFNSSERRLEEFCQAIKYLPEDFTLVAMGKGNDYLEALKCNYESERVIFIPFIRPPYHLLITKMSYIGIMSYFPRYATYDGVINPIYCAPNKIFEYSKYSKPMISNDIPGLSYIFKIYKCGECVTDPITPEKIADTVLKISRNYSEYEAGSLSYYNTIDTKKIVKSIIEG